MKKLSSTLAVIIFLLSLGVTQVQLALKLTTQASIETRWTSPMEAEFQRLSQQAIQKLAGSNYGTTAFEQEKKSYPRAMMDFLAGNHQKAIAFLQSEDADVHRNSHTLGIDFYSSFTLKGQVRKYFYFGKYLDPSYRQRMKRAMAILTAQDPLKRTFSNPRRFWEKSIDNCKTWVDCRNTDNLKAMRDVAVYLFAEETGNQQTRLTYKERLQRNIRTLYQIGQGEWDSENYLGHTITAYLNLYDFAQDHEVKSLAKSALDWLFTSGALKYWRGAFGGPSKRDYSNGNCVWCALATGELGLYFGDSPISDQRPNPDAVYAITSSYRPPSAVVALARKQFKKPLELLNSKPTYENWKPGADIKPQFYETLYFGNTFQIGTLAQGSGGDWNGFKMMAFNSRRGVDYFIAATGTNSKKISTDSIGGDNVAQYRNLVIWLNNQPDAPFQFFLPKSAQLKNQNGVTFIKYEQTWLALTPIHLKINGIDHQAIQKIQSKYPHEQIFTAVGNGNKFTGFALEIGEQATHGSWQQFQQSVMQKSRLNLAQINQGVVEYQGIRGKVKLQYQGVGLPKIWRNGKEHNWLQHFAIYQNADGDQNPINLGWKKGKLIVEAGGYKFQSQVK